MIMNKIVARKVTIALN